MVSLIDLAFDLGLLNLTFEICSSPCEVIAVSSSSELKKIGLLCRFEGRESIPPYNT